MKKGLRNSFALLFIIGGALLLLQTLNIFGGDIGNIIWAAVFSAFGLFFISKYVSNRNNWGWLIPGVSLMGFAVSNLLELLPNVDGTYRGLLALGGIGLSFLLIYFNDRVNWWALIPGGILISLGVISIFDQLEVSGFDTGGILFLGLGLTFLLLFILPTPYGRLNWAIIPAIILLLFGFLIGFGEDLEIGGYIGPAIIILAGIMVLINSLRKERP